MGNGFAKRPEGDGYYGPLKWVPADKVFFWTDPSEERDDFDVRTAGVGKFRGILDPENWRRAWIGFVKSTGEGESKKSGGTVLRSIRSVTEELGPRPSENGLVLMNDGFASGIIARMVMDASLGGVRKELTSTQACMWSALGKFFDQYRAEKDAHPGLLPEGEMVGVGKYLTPRGSTPEPILKIVGWAPRPEILPDEPAGKRDDPPAVVRKPQFRLVVGGSPMPEPPDEEDPPLPLDYPPERGYDPDYD